MASLRHRKRSQWVTLVRSSLCFRHRWRRLQRRLHATPVTHTDFTTISYGHTGRLLVPWCELQVTLRSEKWCACVCIKCNTNVRRCVPLYCMLLLYAFNSIVCAYYAFLCVIRSMQGGGISFVQLIICHFLHCTITYACGATPKRVIITSCVNCVFFLYFFSFFCCACDAWKSVASEHWLLWLWIYESERVRKRCEWVFTNSFMWGYLLEWMLVGCNMLCVCE